MVTASGEKMSEGKIDHVADAGPDIGPTHHKVQDHIAIKTDTYAIDEDALGQNLPKHYYRSFGFIGTVIVSCRV